MWKDQQYISSRKNTVQESVLHAALKNQRFHRHVYLYLYRYLRKYTPDLKTVVTFVSEGPGIQEIRVEEKPAFLAIPFCASWILDHVHMSLNQKQVT